MKKIVLAALAVLSVASVSAATENENTAEAHKYVMEVNALKMTSALNLNAAQYEEVANGETTFADETRAASRKKTEEARKAAFNTAVLRNVKFMRDVLNKEQYRTYLMLLNTTLANRGINL